MPIGHLRYLFMLLIFYLSISYSSAQYFGQNKPTYKQFDFKLYKTPHFDIYYYHSSDSLIKDLAQKSEQWYLYHRQILLDTFQVQNPILLYTSHVDFQQTNAVHSYISIGTGGVTEGFKKRIIMPLGFSTYQTNHVLGHEMVHAFQYDILQKDPYLGIMSIQNIPLWMIEGMAEYLSVGNTDSHTALWMRDALINNNFPTLKQLTINTRYSPYRYGQAFWSYIANTYGEQYIPHLFKETAAKGIDQAISDVFLMPMDTLSNLWKNKLKTHLLKNLNDSTFSIYGERILSRRNSGKYNLSPSVSPDGNKLIFLSERDLFSMDLFVANAQTGKIIKKIYTSTRNDHIDGFNYLETSGTWSPDSKYFAFIAYIKGKSALVIIDVAKNKITDQRTFDSLDAIMYPAWSPNNKTIAFTGLKGGVSDIYLAGIDDYKVINLTNDAGCNLQPIWSHKADKIFYTSDEPSPTQERHTHSQYNIASINVENKQKKIYTTFDGAQNVNPLISSDGSTLFFLSDRDGTRNLYSLNENTQQIYQLTNYPTGISGITPLAPALSIAQNHLYYNMLWEGEFSVIRTSINQIKKTGVFVKDRTVNRYASRLMPYTELPSIVDQNLQANLNIQKTDQSSKQPVKARFKLDYIGNTAVGVMTGRFATGMAGSIEARFSDILGNHMLYTGLSINGEIYDFGGQAAYVNQKRPVKTGLSLSHIPYQTGYYSYEEDESTGEESLSYIFRRTFIDKLNLFAYYPLNKSHRIEAGISAARYSYRTEKIEDYNYYYSISKQESKLIDSPSPFTAGIIDLAYVIDNSSFGLASPIDGKRIRLAYERYFSGINMNTFLFDFRKYFRIKPYSFAFRLYHYGRYGSDSEDNRLFNIYIGYPWYVRGYESGNFFGEETDGKVSTSQLWGSKAVVSNFEWRIPFSGPRDYAWIHSQYFFSELALFYDAGMTWNNDSQPTLLFTTDSNTKRIPLMSTGLALRFNILGAIIIEPFFAFPINQGKVHTGNFGINILSGW